MINIVIDGFGGDNSPHCILKGCENALKEKQDISLSIVGDKDKLKRAADEIKVDLKNFNIVESNSIIKSDEEPSKIIKELKDSSMAVGLLELKCGNADAFVSAGNTGALAIASSTFVGRIKGIKRAALAPVMPSKQGCFILLDAGANLNCRSDMLSQFALMGSIYMQKVLNINNPRIGLANIGVEKNKGTDELKQTYEILDKLNFLNFIGNIEARDVPLGECDVVVADGFSGNMILKSMEGTCIFLIETLKDIFLTSSKTKISALLIKNELAKLKEKMDYTEYGGAILLGISKPVIKAHGSSDANAIKNAIFQARKCVVENIVDEISNNLSKMSEVLKHE